MNSNHDSLSALKTDIIANADKVFGLQTEHCLLDIIGPDAKKFLQGQLSCDLNTVTPHLSTLGSHCNPKGRMLSNFRVIQLADNHYSLVMRRDLRPIAQQALAKYIVFSKAELAPSDNLVGLFLRGENISEALQTCFGELLFARNAVNIIGDAKLIQIDDVAKHFELWTPASSVEEYHKALAEIASLTAASVWQDCLIELGLGQLGPLTSGEYIPLMFNYDTLGGVSFKKGCYTGQEIVARLHYRGQLKRRLYTGTLQTNAAPAENTAIYQSGNEQSCGNVINTTRRGDEIWVLAVISDEAVENNPHLFINSPQGEKIHALSPACAITMKN